MDIERLRKIIAYSDANRDKIGEQVRHFYSLVGMNSDKEVLNIMQIVRPSFQKKGYLVLELPLADREIGALSYKGDALGYIVLNTSLPKVNVNFALCHEVYHIFYQESEFVSKMELINSHYYEHEEEYSANLFASILLMPEHSFRTMYQKFQTESKGSEMDTIVRLMNYFQVPYMAALIRCYELNLTEEGKVLEALLQMDAASVRARFSELWLDERILDASSKDDYERLELLVKRFGQEYMDGAYLNERTLRRVLQNMRALYLEIKGD